MIICIYQQKGEKIIGKSEYLFREVVLDEDATEYKWVTVEELNDMELIKGIDHEIGKVDEILKKRKVG